jgi:hypothetical protein
MSGVSAALPSKPDDLSLILYRKSLTAAPPSSE